MKNVKRVLDIDRIQTDNENLIKENQRLKLLNELLINKLRKIKLLVEDQLEIVNYHNYDLQPEYPLALYEN